MNRLRESRSRQLPRYRGDVVGSRLKVKSMKSPLSKRLLGASASSLWLTVSSLACTSSGVATLNVSGEKSQVSVVSRSWACSRDSVLTCTQGRRDQQTYWECSGSTVLAGQESEDDRAANVFLQGSCTEEEGDWSCNGRGDLTPASQLSPRAKVELGQLRVLRSGSMELYEPGETGQARVLTISACSAVP